MQTMTMQSGGTKLKSLFLGLFVAGEAGYVYVYRRGWGNDVTTFVHVIINDNVTGSRVIWACDTLKNIARLVVTNTDI